MITIYTSDVFVSGNVIYRTPEMVLLEITRPYTDVLVDALLPDIVSDSNPLGGPCGDDVIYYLLKTCYELCRYTEQNMAMLMDAYTALQQEIDGLYYENFSREELDSRVFCKQTLFFYRWYPNMYAPRASWDGLLAMIAQGCANNAGIEREAITPWQTPNRRHARA